MLRVRETIAYDEALELLDATAEDVRALIAYETSQLYGLMQHLEPPDVICFRVWNDAESTALAFGYTLYELFNV